MAAMKQHRFPQLKRPTPKTNHSPQPPHHTPLRKPAKFVIATAALRILKNARNRQIPKKESRSDTAYRLFNLTTVLFATYSLFYVALHVGHRGGAVVKVLCYRQFVETAVAQWLRCCATDSLWAPR